MTTSLSYTLYLIQFLVTTRLSYALYLTQFLVTTSQAYALYVTQSPVFFYFLGKNRVINSFNVFGKYWMISVLIYLIIVVSC